MCYLSLGATARSRGLIGTAGQAEDAPPDQVPGHVPGLNCWRKPARSSTEWSSPSTCRRAQRPAESAGRWSRQISRAPSPRRPVSGRCARRQADPGAQAARSRSGRGTDGRHAEGDPVVAVPIAGEQARRVIVSVGIGEWLRLLEHRCIIHGPPLGIAGRWAGPLSPATVFVSTEASAG